VTGQWLKGRVAPSRLIIPHIFVPFTSQQHSDIIDQEHQSYVRTTHALLTAQHQSHTGRCIECTYYTALAWRRWRFMTSS